MSNPKIPRGNVTAVQTITDEFSRSNYIADGLWEREVWRIPGVSDDQPRIWRISPTPFPIDSELAGLLHRLGPALLSFYNAVNSLYLRSNYPWVNEYLDKGKPDSIIEHSRMNYHKRRLPGIIRPDILLTDEGPRITELDAVPGGMGQLDAMSLLYADLGFDILGSSRGMLHGFDRMIRSAAGKDDPVLAIVVSEESSDYRPEMGWLAQELKNIGRRAFMIRPEELIFMEDGLFIDQDSHMLKLDVVYRFFELFDLKNIPKVELLTYAAKKRLVVVTPPFKHHLEEKMLLALLHHPMLEDYWLGELSAEDFYLLKEIVPRTWILDPRPVPPHAVIPDFRFRGKPIQDWRVIKEGTQKERRLVVKPSGFSPSAWGSRGVVIGHDNPADKWAEAVENALECFDSVPYVLQHFHEGKRIPVRYLDQNTNGIVEMQGRVRLTPYYYVTDTGAALGGALSTVVPPDKKLIHGMVDAVMAPCMVANDVG
ncbi:MAG TPA: hypothetical protein PLU88_10570 [Armatimonadota bacterium]|nr:hypothetical protein [Armatimonadota bacterium]